MIKGYTTDFQYRRSEKRLKELHTRLDESSKEAALAAEHGDLIDNAEFNAAVGEERLNFSRIRELEMEISSCEIVDTKCVATDMVRIGNSIEVLDLDSRSKITFNIVGKGPTYSDKREISYMSPLGAQLIGKRIGFIADVNLPAGNQRYLVLDIKRYNPEH